MTQSPTAGEPQEHPHDFEVQKRMHQQIRNDPDYDDWEYGTEPLPHEAWTPGSGKPRPAAAEGAGEPSASDDAA